MLSTTLNSLSQSTIFCQYHIEFARQYLLHSQYDFKSIITEHGFSTYKNAVVKGFVVALRVTSTDSVVKAQCI